MGDPYQPDDEDALAVAYSMPPLAPLPPGFALRLADQQGVSTRASYAADEVYREPPAGEMDVALTLVMPLRVSLHALHCGILVFDFSDNPDFCGGEEPRWSGEPNPVRQALVARRTRYINAFLPTLWVGGQQAGSGIGTQPTLHLGNFQMAEVLEEGWHVTGSGAAPPPGGWPRVEVYLPGDLFRNAVATFAAIHTAFGEATFELLPLLQEAAALYSTHQFSAALVVGWTAAEAVLARRWRDYLAAAATQAGGPTKITTKRRERLEGRDFTASIVTEVLSLAGRVDERHREALDVARRARNAFAHELVACDPGQAFLGASVAAQMIGEDAGCDFRVSSDYSYQW